MVGLRTINVGFIPSGTAIVCRQALPASPLTAVLLIAFTTRLLAAWAWPNIYNPDETFQAVEQAHRLLYGYGVIPWEFQHGARSWVFPGLLAALMRVGAIIFGAQSGHTIGVTVGMSLVSLIPVWVGFAWGLRIGGVPAAVVAGAAPAIWFEAVYFGAKSSIETVAGSMLLLGVFLAYSTTGGNAVRLFFAGCALGFSLILRIQFAPAIGLTLLGLCGLNWRRKWAPMAAGLALPVGLAGIVDAITWSYPFESFVQYFSLNILSGVARGFGTAPFYSYLKQLALRWSAAVAPLLILAFFAARRLPLVLGMSFAIIVSHSFIAHNEYRFVVAGTSLIVLLAALGSAELLGVQSGRPAWRPALLLAAWSITSLVLAVGGHQRPYWIKSRDHILAFQALAKADDLCGVGLWGVRWTSTPGYAGLHRNVPLYEATPAAPLKAIQSGFNYLLVSLGSVPDPPFAPWRKYRTDILYRRPGGCFDSGNGGRILLAPAPPSVGIAPARYSPVNLP